MRKRKECVAFLLALALLLTLAWGIAWLLMPPRTAYGCMWDSYRKEERDSVELLVVGSSLAYCDVIPAYLWEETGVAAYVVAGPEQTLPISYYCIREACKTQSPRRIMLELSEMFFPKTGHYTLVNISYMPLSANRIGATFAGAEPDEWFGLLFPLYSYHSRWAEATGEELRARLQAEADVLAGYTLLTDRIPMQQPFEREASAETEDYAAALRYLESIRDFCAAQNIELMCYITPAAAKIPSATLDTLTRDMAALGLTLTNFNDNIDELGLDNDNDWYDANHLNVRGAEKFTRWLGGYLQETCGLTPSGTADAALWSERLAYVTQRRAEADG